MRARTIVPVILAALCLAPGLFAAGPTFWTIATAGDFLHGTSRGVYIDLAGNLTPGPSLTGRLTSTPAQVWSLAAAPDGTLWIGTGGDGHLLRSRPGQAEETVATTAESGVFAIAVSGSRVYYATSPSGRVYVYDGNGPARPFFDPKAKYIWALAVDRGGRVWVGTGDPAAIYRVDATGTDHLVYKPPAAHVVCLAEDASGRMLAGTESPGRLYRFDASDRPYAMIDTGLAEVRAVANGPNGAVFVAATGHGDDSSTSSDSGSGGSAGDEGSATGDLVLSVAAATSPQTSGTTSGSTGSGAASGSHKSTIFRIEADGTWQSLWETADIVYDIALDRDGGLFVASGPDGRLYKIVNSQDVQLLTGLDAKEITRLVQAPGGGVMALGTANPGRVMMMSSAPAANASYESPVRDTKGPSTWGTIRWDATGPVTLFSRSGNTHDPDDSWSDWSGPYSAAAGEAIRSAPARYLQWRAVFGPAPSGQPAPRLTAVTVAYLPVNTRPVVSSITTPPPGVVFQRQFSGDDAAIAGLDDAIADARRPAGDAGAPAPPPGRRMYQKGLQTITWKADDADGDRLTYALLYRREGESVWHPLRDGLTDTIFVWDTTTVPDGRYTVRVVASDASSNSADRALAGDRESDPIDIDNTPPVLTMEISRTGGAIHLLVHARDAQSPIAKLEYTLGGNQWRIAYPVDGVSDSPDERYDIAVASEADLARLVVRVTDALDNVTAQAAPVR